MREGGAATLQIVVVEYSADGRMYETMDRSGVK